MPVEHARKHWPSLLVAAGFGVLVLAPLLEDVFYHWWDRAHPVNRGWRPVSVMRDGNDLIVAGTMVKARCDCVYVPPPRARDAFGQNYRVISTSPTATQSWACSPGPQNFGPWRIVGAANVRVTAYQEHKCGSRGRAVFTMLGEVAAP